MATNNVVNTIQSTVNYCAAFILNRPTQNVAGQFQEPALTLANLIMATILSPPFAWQWNRATNTSISTTSGNSDYSTSIPDFGWLEKATIQASNGSAIEIQVSTSLASSVDEDQPMQICPVFDDNAGNITFRLLPAPDQVYSLTLTYQKAPIKATSLYGASLGSITSIAAASGGTTVYTASGGVTGGASNGLAGTFLLIQSATTSANNGVFYCTASNTTTVTLVNSNGVLQSGAAGYILALTTWAPIPDKYNFLYERAMLAHLHNIYDNASYVMELQIFFRQLVGCSEGLSDTAKAIFLEDRLSQLRTTAAAQAAVTASPRRGQ